MLEEQVSELLARIATLENQSPSAFQVQATDLSATEMNASMLELLRQQTEVLAAQLKNDSQSEEQLTKIYQALNRQADIAQKEYDLKRPGMIATLVKGVWSLVTFPMYLMGNYGLGMTIGALLFSAAVPVATPYFAATAPAAMHATTGIMAKMAAWATAKVSGAIAASIGAAMTSSAAAIAAVSPSLWLSATLGAVLPVNYLLIAGAVGTLNLNGQMTRFNQLGFRGIVIEAAKDAVRYVVAEMAAAPGNIARSVAGRALDAVLGRERQNGHWQGHAPRGAADSNGFFRLESAVPSATWLSDPTSAASLR